MSETSVIAYMSGNAPAEVDATHPLPVTNTPSGTQTVDTELPAAAALNGTIAKSVSAPVVGAALLVSDNTNLIQPLGDAANGLDVDVTRLPSIPAGTNEIGHVVLNSTRTPTTLTITNGTSTSAAVDCGNTVLVGIEVPSGLTVITALSFQVSRDNSTFQTLYDETNTVFSLTVAASRNYSVPPYLFAPWRYVKLVGNGNASADRIFGLSLLPV